MTPLIAYAIFISLFIGYVIGLFVSTRFVLRYPSERPQVKLHAATLYDTLPDAGKIEKLVAEERKKMLS